jgi:tetratricopeptide (TPR) repeat protein
MKSISKLKDEARKHEQREEWEKAIQAYLQVLRVADEEEAEVELPLYNRLGDLCVRLGRAEEAVRHYEQAADRYAEAGLYNNAIALCNKALRYSPDRLQLIRKLGQFSALQGFITDARRYFLDYAERQFNGGHVDDALTALEDFANVADDADVRELLGRRLHAHGRTVAAVAELQRAYAMRIQAGDTERAMALRTELQAMDPNAVIEDLPAGAPVRPAAPSVPDLPGFMEPDDADAVAAGVEESPADPLESPAAGAFGDDVAAADTGIEAGTSEIAGIESGPDSFASGAAVQDVEGLETTTFDFSEVAADSVPDLGIVRDDASLQEGDVISLPDEPVDGESTDLPLLGDDPFGDAGPPPAQQAPAETATAARQPEPPAPLDLGTSFSFELPGDEKTRTADADMDAGLFELPTLPGVDDAPTAAGADDDGIDLPALDGPAFDGADDFEATPLAWEPDPGPTFDLSAFQTDSAAFDLPTLDEPQPAATPDPPEADRAFDLPTLDEPDIDAPAAHGPAFDLPTLDDAPLPFDVPTPEEPDTGFDLPELEEPDTGVDLPELEAPDTDFDLPELEEPDTDFDLPELEEPDTELELPELEGPDTELELPELEEPEYEIDAAPGQDETETVVSASAPSAATGSPPESPQLPVEVPAIELPTWNLESPVEAEGAPATAAPETEWPEIADFEDPVDAASHSNAWLDDMEEPAAAVDPAAPVSEPSDWLQDIAEDEAAAAQQFATDASGDVFADDDSYGGGLAEADEAAAVGPAIEDVTRNADAAAAAAREMAATPTPDEYVDLGALLAEDSSEQTTRFKIQETSPTGDEDRDFAELLNQFKSKVHEHLPPEDAAAHYDLGLAFKEMGLIDEAIGEFQVALRAGHMRLQVYEELGGCFLMKEQYNIAEKVLTRALEMNFDDELELLGVYYHLGRAYEALGRRDQARDAYERVLGMDINFEDVTARLARL